MSTPEPVLITGVVLDPDDNPAAGKLVFANPVPVRSNTTDEVMVPDEIVVPVGADGIVSVLLPATDDPDWSPVGWTWQVRPHFPFWKTPFSVAVPYDSPGGQIDFSSLVQVPPDGDGELYALINHTHEGGGGGGGNPIVMRKQRVVSGNVTPQNTGGVWQLLTGGPTISIPAAVGDRVEFTLLDALIDPRNSSFYDLAVIVNNAPVRYLSTGGPAPQTEGVSAFYWTFIGQGPIFDFVVGSDDLSGGNVTVGFAVKSGGAGQLYASNDYSLQWRAVNYGPVTVL